MKSLKWSPAMMALSCEFGGPKHEPRLPDDLHVLQKKAEFHAAVHRHSRKPKRTVPTAPWKAGGTESGSGDDEDDELETGVDAESFGGVTVMGQPSPTPDLQYEIHDASYAEKAWVQKRFRDIDSPARMGTFSVPAFGWTFLVVDVGSDMVVGSNITRPESCVFLHLAAGLGTPANELYATVLQSLRQAAASTDSSRQRHSGASLLDQVSSGGKISLDVIRHLGASLRDTAVACHVMGPRGYRVVVYEPRLKPPAKVVELLLVGQHCTLLVPDGAEGNTNTWRDFSARLDLARRSATPPRVDTAKIWTWVVGNSQGTEAGNDDLAEWLEFDKLNTAAGSEGNEHSSDFSSDFSERVYGGGRKKRKPSVKVKPDIEERKPSVKVKLDIEEIRVTAEERLARGLVMTSDYAYKTAIFMLERMPKEKRENLEREATSKFNEVWTQVNCSWSELERLYPNQKYPWVSPPPDQGKVRFKLVKESWDKLKDARQNARMKQQSRERGTLIYNTKHASLILGQLKKWAAQQRKLITVANERIECAGLDEPASVAPMRRFVTPSGSRDAFEQPTAAASSGGASSMPFASGSDPNADSACTLAAGTAVSVGDTFQQGLESGLSPFTILETLPPIQESYSRLVSIPPLPRVIKNQLTEAWQQWRRQGKVGTAMRIWRRETQPRDAFLAYLSRKRKYLIPNGDSEGAARISRRENLYHFLDLISTKGEAWAREQMTKFQEEEDYLAMAAFAPAMRMLQMQASPSKKGNPSEAKEYPTLCRTTPTKSWARTVVTQSSPASPGKRLNNPLIPSRGFVPPTPKPSTSGVRLRLIRQKRTRHSFKKRGTTSGSTWELLSSVTRWDEIVWSRLFQSSLMNCVD